VLATIVHTISGDMLSTVLHELITETSELTVICLGRVSTMVEPIGTSLAIVLLILN